MNKPFDAAIVFLENYPIDIDVQMWNDICKILFI